MNIYNKKIYTMINKRNEKWSEEKKLQFKKNYITGKIDNINIEILSNIEIEKLFHELKVISVNKSQNKRIKTIKNKSEYEWSKITKKGALNRKINFLKINNIIGNDNYTNEELDKLFNQYFNKITHHGEKIKIGRHKKYKTEDEYKLSFINGLKQSFLNYCIKNNFNLNPDNYDELYRIFCKRIQHDISDWKKSHLNKRKIEYTEENFNEKYSEYIRERFKMVDTVKNGYKRTKKGWFEISNSDKIFYRSSWELKVLKYLYALYKEHIVEYICVPERILFYVNGYKHYYYPDIEFKLYNYETKIIEIKPKFKINENKLKLEAAKEKYNKNFIILSEEDIYDNDLKNKLIEYGKL